MYADVYVHIRVHVPMEKCMRVRVHAKMHHMSAYVLESSMCTRALNERLY